MNAQPTPSFKAMLAVLNLIYASLIAVLTLFAGVVYYLNSSGGNQVQPDVGLASTLRYVLIAVSPAALGAGYFIFKKLLSSASATATLQEKLQRLQTAVLIRSACFEIPGLLGAVGALITGENSFLLFTAVIIVFFFLLRPSTYSIAQDLSLSQGEREMIEKTKA